MVGLKPWGLVRLFGELFVAGKLACRQRKCVTGASSASLQHISPTKLPSNVALPSKAISRNQAFAEQKVHLDPGGSGL
jgi:hypothetical protein